MVPTLPAQQLDGRRGGRSLLPPLSLRCCAPATVIRSYAVASLKPRPEAIRVARLRRLFSHAAGAAAAAPPSDPGPLPPLLRQPTLACPLTAMVYITSDLFNPESISERSASSAAVQAHIWSPMVDPQPTSGLGKRKRRIDAGDEGSSSQYDNFLSHIICPDTDALRCSTCPTHQRSPPIGKGLLRLHGHDPAFEAGNNRPWPHSMATATYLSTERRPIKQMRRLSPKAALVKSSSHLMDIEPDHPPSSPKAAKPDAHDASDLRPCHACKTAPKRKRDLENYMECKRCDGRTCYICARECSACQKPVCKKCIVEVGEEGDPWCLECYSRQINS